MSMRYPGGFIASTPVTAAYPSGVWTQAQAIPYQAQNVWTRDQYWPYTTLLLQGDGAVNGAQNNTFLDSSSNNFTITRNGNTTQGAFTPYEQDGYWSNFFDGSGDYLLNSSNTIIAATGDFTVECWIYLNNLSAAQYVFSVSSSTTLFEIYVTTGGAIGIQTGSNYRETAAGTLAIGTWYHLAVTRSGSTYTTYLNGSSQTYTASGGTMLSTLGTTPTAIGARSGGTNAVLAGYVSNFRVVTSVVYTGAFTPPSVPLTAITNTSLLTCQSNRFKDNSTNNFTVTPNGSPSVQAFQPFPGATTYSGTVLGGSAYFDGSGDYLSFANSSLLNIGAGDFTVEAWIYPITKSGNQTFFYKGNTVGAGYDWLLAYEGGVMNVYYGGGSFSAVTDTSVAQAWNHVALVRNTANNTLRVYINGVQAFSTTYTGTYASSVGGQIGATTALSGGYYFNGYISGFRVAQSAIYTSAFTPPTTPPTTSASNTQMLVNYTNAAIFDAAVMNDLETVGNAQVSTSVVKYGTGSMAFDGSGDRLVFPFSPWLQMGSGDWTIEMWLYINAAPGGGLYFDLYTNRASVANFSPIAIFVNDARKIEAYFSTSGSSWTSTLTTTGVIATGTWTHVAVVRSGSTVRVYFNGTADATTATISGALFSNTSQLFIGGEAGGNDLNGYLDDFRVTKGAARYITNFTPPIARLPAQ